LICAPTEIYLVACGINVVFSKQKNPNYETSIDTFFVFYYCFYNGFQRKAGVGNL
jgi:hypothetical protein